MTCPSTIIKPRNYGLSSTISELLITIKLSGVVFWNINEIKIGMIRMRARDHWDWLKKNENPLSDLNKLDLSLSTL